MVTKYHWRKILFPEGLENIDNFASWLILSLCLLQIFDLIHKLISNLIILKYTLKSQRYQIYQYNWLFPDWMVSTTGMTISWKKPGICKPSLIRDLSWIVLNGLFICRWSNCRSELWLISNFHWFSNKVQLLWEGHRSLMQSATRLQSNVKTIHR